VDTIQAIKDGRISMTVVQGSVIQGRWGIRAAIWAAEGKADQLVKQYWTPIQYVDKDNADTFQFVGHSRQPDGWVMP
jgi:ABC-type sugar transport system substrate-binding protein